MIQKLFMARILKLIYKYFEKKYHRGIMRIGVKKSTYVSWTNFTQDIIPCNYKKKRKINRWREKASVFDSQLRGGKISSKKKMVGNIDCENETDSRLKKKNFRYRIDEPWVFCLFQENTNGTELFFRKQRFCNFQHFNLG